MMMMVMFENLMSFAFLGDEFPRGVGLVVVMVVFVDLMRHRGWRWGL